MAVYHGKLLDGNIHKFIRELVLNSPPISSIFHPTILQNDVRQTDRLEGHGIGGQRIFQISNVDKRERSSRFGFNIFRRRGFFRSNNRRGIKTERC